MFLLDCEPAGRQRAPSAGQQEELQRSGSTAYLDKNGAILYNYRQKNQANFRFTSFIDMCIVIVCAPDDYR